MYVTVAFYHTHGTELETQICETCFRYEKDYGTARPEEVYRRRSYKLCVGPCANCKSPTTKRRWQLSPSSPTETVRYSSLTISLALMLSFRFVIPAMFMRRGRALLGLLDLRPRTIHLRSMPNALNLVQAPASIAHRRPAVNGTRPNLTLRCL